MMRGQKCDVGINGKPRFGAENRVRGDEAFSLAIRHRWPPERTPEPTENVVPYLSTKHETGGPSSNVGRPSHVRVGRGVAVGTDVGHFPVHPPTRPEEALRPADDPQRARLTHIFEARNDRAAVIDEPEFPHYVAAKFYVYHNLMQKVVLRSGSPRPAHGSSKETVRVRSLRDWLGAGAGKGPGNPGTFSDFTDTTHQLFRERLQSLNHGSVLKEIGRGARRAVEYHWVEPVLYSNVCSFLALRRLVGNDYALAFDAYRLREIFQEKTFKKEEFHQLFQHYWTLQKPMRWYRLLRDSMGESLRFKEALNHRLGHMAGAGIIRKEDAAHVLTPKGLEAAHWVDLFVHSVAYLPQASQCEVCPMQRACDTGQLALALDIPNGGLRRKRALAAANSSSMSRRDDLRSPVPPPLTR